jgi:hypothetical protein
LQEAKHKNLQAHIMYKLLFDGMVFPFATLDEALTASKMLVVEWTIQDSQGDVVFDWTDRVGP